MLRPRRRPRLPVARLAFAGLAALAALAATARALTPEEARDRRWAERDTPAATAAGAARFVALLNLGDDFASSGLSGRVELRPVAAALKNGDTAAALSGFENYFYGKLGNPVSYGLTAGDLSPASSGTAGYGRFPPALWGSPAASDGMLARADDLLAGRIRRRGKVVQLGPPGKVNWYWPLDYGQVADPGRPGVFPDPDLVAGNVLLPLACAYVSTHDERYLDAWAAYLDDWSLNATYVENVRPLRIPDSIHSTIANTPRNIARALAALSAATPPPRHPLPTRVFAQVLCRVFGEYPFANIAYLRSNTHNWTPFPGLMFTALLGDEFVTSPLFFREARRRYVEDNAVTQNLRDGSENQQDPWYNDNYANTLSALRLMDARDRMDAWREVRWVKDAQLDGRWMDETREHLRERVTYQIHLRTPQGEWPIPYRGGDKRKADRASRLVSPEAYADPVNLAILSAVDRRGDRLPPPYYSDWFPYGGYAIVRQGWGPRDGYGALFCSPQPGAYGAYRSRSNNNTFGLAADGQDLLVDDCVGHYMYPSSPLRVDGGNQFFHGRDGVYKVRGLEAHKTYEVRAWTEPAPWRWSSTERFDLMEGVYDGPYTTPASVAEEEKLGTMPVGAGIRGVSHQRLVVYARRPGLWVVLDRVRSPVSHAFGQVWMFPLNPGTAPAFDPADIVTDQAAQLVGTESAAFVGPRRDGVRKANLTLYQVGSEPLTYRKKIVPKNPKNHYMVYGRDEVTAGWTASGASQVATLLQPRVGGAGRLRDFKSVRLSRDNVVGFRAVADDGREVSCLSAATGAAGLTLGAVAAEAGLLVLTDDAGLVLDARSLTVGGRPVTLPAPDCDFSLKDGRIADLTPIWRPISPVVIGPEQTVFTGSLDMTLGTPTPGVDIRYTLDGSDPTPGSPLYTGPVRIRDSVVVKARAYRPGTTANPVTTDGTRATPVSSAVFSLRRPLPALSPDPATQPGLRFSYWQGNWESLWARAPDNLAPSVQATVGALFDLSRVPAGNPPLGTAPAPRALPYAVQYSGYLEVPADGVYTFYAPPELVYPDIEAGYDLRLWVGSRDRSAGAASPRALDMNEWYPSTRLHAFGAWSIALQKGAQPFRLFFLDYRMDAAKRLNRDGLRPYVWPGSTPELLVSGPGLPRQPIPPSWFKF